MLARVENGGEESEQGEGSSCESVEGGNGRVKSCGDVGSLRGGDGGGESWLVQKRQPDVGSS